MDTGAGSVATPARMPYRKRGPGAYPSTGCRRPPCPHDDRPVDNAPRIGPDKGHVKRFANLKEAVLAGASGHVLRL